MGRFMESGTGTATLNGYNGTNGAGMGDEIDDGALISRYEAERSLLANILADPDLAPEAIEYLEAIDFAHSGYAAMYAAIKELTEAGLPIQPSDVRDALQRDGMALEEAAALVRLPFAEDLLLVPSVFRKNLEDLRRWQVRRRFELASREIENILQRHDEAPGQMAAAIADIIKGRLPLETVEAEDVPYEDDELGPEPDLGWVAEYADTVADLTNSPRAFNVLIALVLGATAIKGRAVLNMGFSKIRPNLYGALVGKSTVFHKSTALGKGIEVLAAAGLDMLLLPDAGTSEGLLAALAERPHGVMVRDEVARLFASDRIKYTATMKQDLTAIFDGTTINKRLSGTDMQIRNPYVSIIGATTPARFYDAVGDRDWDDGFLVRWLWALPDCEPDFDAPAPAMLSDAEYTTMLALLAAPLRDIAGRTETTFILGAGAFDAWDTWQREGLRRAHEYGDDSALAIMGRMATAALKMAMVLAAVNGRWGHISAETMRSAIWLADIFRHNTWTLLTERANHGTSGHKLAKALRIIKQRGGTAGCTKTTIMQYGNMKSHELRPVLDKLLQIGAVTISDDGRRYRAEHDKLPVKAYV